MKLLSILLFVTASLLSACANTGHMTSGLKESTGADFYEIGAPLTYVEVRGVTGVRWEEGLLPCVLKPTSFNSEGTFYEGNGNCVTRNMGGDMMGSPYRGGIWVPSDQNRALRLYYYFDYNKRSQ